MNKIKEIKFLLGEDFENKYVELVFEDGTGELHLLSEKLVKELNNSDLATHGTFKVE